MFSLEFLLIVFVLHSMLNMGWIEGQNNEIPIPQLFPLKLLLFLSSLLTESSGLTVPPIVLADATPVWLIGALVNIKPDAICP